MAKSMGKGWSEFRRTSDLPRTILVAKGGIRNSWIGRELAFKRKPAMTTQSAARYMLMPLATIATSSPERARAVNVKPIAATATMPEK